MGSSASVVSQASDQLQGNGILAQTANVLTFGGLDAGLDSARTKNQNVGGSGADAWNFLTSPFKKQTPPDIAAAPTPPDPAAARMTGIASSLDSERTLRAGQTSFTGGRGLLDTPNTASRVLLGS